MRILTLLLALLAVCTQAQAHFSEDVRTRTLVLAGDNDALRVYMQAPLPLIFST